MYVHVSVSPRETVPSYTHRQGSQSWDLQMREPHMQDSLSQQDAPGPRTRGSKQPQDADDWSDVHIVGASARRMTSLPAREHGTAAEDCQDVGLCPDSSVFLLPPPCEAQEEKSV